MDINSQRIAFKVPLGFEAHEIAHQCYQGIYNPNKAKQVYHNTLAIYAVDYYLCCMGFETDWKQSDSRNQWMLKLMNVADLDVKNIGKLECCPILADADFCEIPPEVRTDRIGYVVVQLSQSLKEAVILGFTTQVAANIPLKQLKYVEDLLAYLSQKEQAPIIKLQQWMEGVITEGWQKIDKLLSLNKVNIAFTRNINVSLGKKIDLGLQIDGKSVALIVKLTSENQETFNILIQVHPFEDVYLPEGLNLILIDETGEVVLNTTSRQHDNWIELEFSAQLSERFIVDICLGESKVRQEFIV